MGLGLRDCNSVLGYALHVEGIIWSLRSVS